MYEFGTRRPCKCEPTARKSGCRHQAQRRPLTEYAATVSSVVVGVPLASYAPAAMTKGLYAGLASPGSPMSVTSLPAAATTTIPAFHACSAAYDSGSSADDCVEFVPYDRLSTRMCMPLSSLCW